jgi:hypothetical protein
MGGCIASALADESAAGWWVQSWGLSAQEQDEVWVRWRRGESLRLIARRLGKRARRRERSSFRPEACNGIHRAATRCLSMAEREEISPGIAAVE